MLQDFARLFNTLLKNNPHITSDVSIIHQFHDFERLLLSDPCSFSRHSFKADGRKTFCSSSQLTYFSTYQRNLITTSNYNASDSTLVNIPVYYCDCCHHFHATLPSHIFVPYCQYSLFFILTVVYEKKYSSLTVEKLCLKYAIAPSTLYRWLKKFSAVLRMYLSLTHKDVFHFFLESRYCLFDLIHRYFNNFSITFFEISSA